MSVKVEQLVFGLGLVGLGVVWTLGNLGKLDALDTLHRWWPLLLVVWGGLELAVSLARRAQARRS
ncbi:MAG TPA: DUF5668 domain-containing protein [Vicinamibacteria bacterium]